MLLFEPDNITGGIGKLDLFDNPQFDMLFEPKNLPEGLLNLKCASPSHVLDVLVDKSLVKIDVDGHLEMHDHLRDMGRMIVEREEVYKGTRIWKKDMIHSANGQTNKVFYM